MPVNVVIKIDVRAKLAAQRLKFFALNVIVIPPMRVNLLSFFLLVDCPVPLGLGR
jgi:hypothetical protein